MNDNTYLAPSAPPDVAVNRAGPLVPGGGCERPLTAVMRPILWCGPADCIRDVARQIGDGAQSCALMWTERGLGIATDHDFRRRVATGDLAVDAPVGDLATVPAITIASGETQATALVRMVEHGVHHLVVTGQDGQPVGVVRTIDLGLAEARDPLIVRSAIESAATFDALAVAARLLPGTIAELRANGVSAVQVGALQSAVVDAIVRRVLELRPGAPTSDVRHSWVLLGSLARREPLPQSDVDTALVWEDPSTTGPDPADRLRASAAEVMADLTRCGLKPCPSGANADNPLFSRSRSAWVSAAAGWMDDPTMAGALLLSAMVADSRPLTEAPLGRHLTDSIRSHTRTIQFLRAILDEALGWKPPTGFVRDFVVHHTGEHRGQLDLKRGGLAPVVALGRWIAITTGDAGGTTPERLLRGVGAGLLTNDEAQTLAGGFASVYSILLDHEVDAIRSGATATTYIAPRDLDTLTRRHLRESFRAITLVQNRVDQDWIRRLTG